MKIGILVTSISNFGQKGFYNSQEIGLAKALSKNFESVEVYKLVSIGQEEKTENICDNAIMHFAPAKNSGINGLIDTEILDKSLDALIHFSDTQFSVPKVYKFCKKNTIQYIPYIGVVESHSTSKLKQLITNLLFKKNLAVYRRCLCCVKTPTIQQKLMDMGVENSVVTPVGLDTDLLRKDYEDCSTTDLKKKYGYNAEDKVLLFIGRLIEEKQPIRMIEILSEIRKKNQSYKLLMVGTGELKTAVEKKIKELDLINDVQMIDRIPNSDIWELYRFAGAFVNLNRQEIFGMAILEAMYYGCKVVAWEAPGPNLIIENGKSGFLVNRHQVLLNCIIDGKLNEEDIHRRIVDCFTWEQVAKIMSRQIQTDVMN